MTRKSRGLLVAFLLPPAAHTLLVACHLLRLTPPGDERWWALTGTILGFLSLVRGLGWKALPLFVLYGPVMYGGLLLLTAGIYSLTGAATAVPLHIHDRVPSRSEPLASQARAFFTEMAAAPRIPWRASLRTTGAYRSYSLHPDLRQSNSAGPFLFPKHLLYPGWLNPLPKAKFRRHD